MEKAFARAEELADNLKEYVNTRIESVKLKAAEKGSYVIANVVAAIAVATIFMLFVGFAGLALAFVLGAWIGRIWAGFLVVALLYLLIAIVLWIARERLIRLPVMNALIQQLFKNEEEK